MVAGDANGGFIGGKKYDFSPGLSMPAYTVGLGFHKNSSDVVVHQFFGPLDVDLVSQSNTYLDRVMNFGWMPIQPFSRTVLWLLRFLHSYGLNYGIILIFFAFGIRIITGPLTKKSFASSAKMQEIQPKIVSG